MFAARSNAANNLTKELALSCISETNSNFGGLIPFVPLPLSYLPDARVLACLSSILFPIFQILKY
jgi:hypothetical protein